MTRHRFDPFSFVVGLVCVGVAVLAFMDPTGLRIEDLRVAGPAVVLLLGLTLLVGGGRRDRTVAVAEPTGVTPVETLDGDPDATPDATPAEPVADADPFEDREPDEDRHT